MVSESILAGEENELIFTNVAPGDFEIVVSGNGDITGCSTEFDGPTQGFSVAIAGVIIRSQAFCGAI